jgi:G3E family GTPase
VSSAVAAINPTLRVYRTDHSQIGLDKLFNLRAYAAPPPTSDADAGCADCAHGEVNHAHAHGHHAHGITTTTIPLPLLSAAQFADLNDFLEEFIWAGKLQVGGKEVQWDGERPEILRTKGYLAVDGAEKVVQGVADLFEIREAVGSGDATPKLVFIGRRVDARLGEVVRARLGL